MVWRWFTEDSHLFLVTPWLQITLALTSVICGAIVGAEREKQEKPAGLRTLMLVCLGSAAFTMASFAFASTTGDSGRVSAQIVTGIGFLGAGAILHGAGIIRGMTTAATIWATAATGMIVGIGYAGAGLGMSLLTRLVLTGALALENRGLGDQQSSRVELVFEANGGKTRARIRKIMEDFHLTGPLELSAPGPDGLVQGSLTCRLPRKRYGEFLNDIASLKEVKEIKELSR
jgi:putative Mg2+ transporter-C (MgtC) family protein